MTEREIESKMYPTVLREMIRHENDLTNHRIMWLLIGQGLIANAYVGVAGGSPIAAAALSAVGVLLTLSTYVILYKSYQARGYLEFLGGAAKAGKLRDTLLPMMGWPSKRVKDWYKGVWSCAFLGKPSDLLEPYLFLPVLLLLVWTVVLVRQWVTSDLQVVLPLCGILSMVLLSGFSIIWVGMQKKDETETLDDPKP